LALEPPLLEFASMRVCVFACDASTHPRNLVKLPQANLITHYKWYNCDARSKYWCQSSRSASAGVVESRHPGFFWRGPMFCLTILSTGALSCLENGCNLF